VLVSIAPSIDIRRLGPTITSGFDPSQQQHPGRQGWQLWLRIQSMSMCIYAAVIYHYHVVIQNSIYFGQMYIFFYDKIVTSVLVDAMRETRYFNNIVNDIYNMEHSCGSPCKINTEVLYIINMAWELTVK
jgi:hypothetical protein